jgi:hypothetical protein
MEYLSLYDYLGKAAGEKLGKEVASAASREGIKLETREVSNPKYTGTVLLYPKEFLEFYFREPQSNLMDELVDLNPHYIVDELPKGHDWTGNLEDDDLPF